MAQVSAAIAIAASTPFVPVFPRCTKIKVAVVFYTAEAATQAQAVAIGSGARTLTVSAIDSAEGSASAAGQMTMPITGASVTDQAARTWKVLDVGPTSGGLSIVASGGSDPGAATHYRIWADAVLV